MKKYKATTDYSKYYTNLSSRITQILRSSGPLTLQELQILTQESNLAISTTVGMMYQDNVIDIRSNGMVISVNLA